MISKTKSTYMDIHSILLDSVLYLETKFNLKEKIRNKSEGCSQEVNKCFLHRDDNLGLTRTHYSHNALM